LQFGEYVLLDTIGAGGMDEVYKARHRCMKRVAAIKVLPKAAVNSLEAVKHFQREVEGAADLCIPTSSSPTAPVSKTMNISSPLVRQRDGLCVPDQGRRTATGR